MGRAEDKRQAARDAAAHHGLRASVPHYLEAAQALVEIRRPEEAVDLLGELLVAQEKKRGLFGRVEKNPLGHIRSQVAVKFADYSRMAAPTEDVLELLGELALEFPDDPTVRRANADALYNAGYIADATEEYRYCLRLNPDDGQILSRLTDAYADMGRNDHAIEFLRRGMRVHAEAKDFGQAMHLAIRWLGMAPGAAEDVIMLLKDWPADALRRQIGGINQLATLVKKDDIHDASWHRSVAAEFAALGAGGRLEAPAEAPVSAVKSDTPPTRPAQPAATAPPSRPAVAQPPTVARPAAPSPAPAAGRPAVTSEKPRPAQTQRPVAPPEPARPIPVQRPSTIPASAPQRTGDSREVKPAAASATTAPPAHAPSAAAPPSRSAPSPAPSMSLPTLEKVLEEADQRKPAAGAPPPTIGRPAAPPIVSKPPSTAPQARSAPPQAEARPAAPSAPDVKPAEPTAAKPAAPAEPPRAVAGGTAAGIKNFARRKAKELYDAGDYAGAIGSLERVARFGPDAETLQTLLDCYTRLNQPDDAKRVGMQLADLEVEAGRVEAAVAALTLLAKAVPDPEVLKRRSELMAAKG